MLANKEPSLLVGSPLPALPEAGSPVPRVYNCVGCRYVDAHGLVCDVCLRKILDGQTERKPSLLIQFQKRRTEHNDRNRKSVGYAHEKHYP